MFKYWVALALTVTPIHHSAVGQQAADAVIWRDGQLPSGKMTLRRFHLIEHTNVLACRRTKSGSCRLGKCDYATSRVEKLLISRDKVEKRLGSLVATLEVSSFSGRVTKLTAEEDRIDLTFSAAGDGISSEFLIAGDFSQFPPVIEYEEVERSAKGEIRHLGVCVPSEWKLIPKPPKALPPK